ncbi:MAG: hypothetical protein MI796_17270, partial [Enterobacterales bacterium]|nr:hypothetical protein [Enterobacterales bacterium]
STLFSLKFRNHCSLIPINTLVKLLNNITAISRKKKKASNTEYYWLYVKYRLFTVLNLTLIAL